MGIGAGVGSISSVGPTSEAEASVAQGGEDELLAGRGESSGAA